MRRSSLVAAAVLAGLGTAFWLGRAPLTAVLFEQGLESRREGRLDDALRRFELAARLGHREARLEEARARTSSGDTAAARRVLDELYEAEIEDPRLAARLLAADARHLYVTGQRDAASERYGEALEAVRALGDARLEARVLLSSAELLYSSLGDLDEARARLGRALELSRTTGDEPLEADVLSSLGVFYWWYERQRDRVLDDFYLPALEIYEQLGDRRGLAGTRSRIGLVYLARGEYDDCARELEASRALYEEIGDLGGLGSAYSYLGAMYVGLESHAQAHESYQKGLEIAAQTNDDELRRRLEPLVADLELRRGEYRRAAELFERLIAAAPDPSIALRNHLTSRGHALLHLGAAEAARASYRRALGAADAVPGNDEPFRSRILTGLAHAAMQVGDLEDAERRLEEAEAIEIAAKGWGEAVHTALARADLADLRGDREASLRYLVVAAEIESRTFGAALSHFFQSQYRQVFERLVSLLFSDGGRFEEAETLTFLILEQMRYRSFRSVLVRLADASQGPRPLGAEALETIRRIEELTRGLDRRFTEQAWNELRKAYASYEDEVLRSELAQERYRLAAESRPIGLGELRQRLDGTTALVEYVLTGEHAFALVVRRGGVSSVRLPVTTPQLESKVKLFRDALFADSPAAPEGERWRPLAGELGRLVIEPMEASGALDGVRRLVVVPMGFLHELPFAAVMSSEAGFLIERYSLQLAPSATLWARGRTASPGAGAVAFGLGDAGGSELEPLAFAENEARAVAETLGGDARVGREATERAFKDLAPSTRFVHVAVHGLVERRVPLYSRLRLEPGGGDDGNLTVREILELGMSAELVTLSACDTALSRSAGLEVDRLGFVEAFLHAGTRNVLASLLPLSDAATAAFMTAFYREMRTAAPAEALAAAQRRMLGGGVDAPEAASDLRHPRYWAPFVLVGGAEPAPEKPVGTYLPG